MNQKKLPAVIAGLSLLLAMAMAASSALAHGQGHGTTGKITKVSSASVTVQTQSGSITEQLTGSTVVMKETRGGLSDLAPGTFVRVTLTSGSNTVTAVHIESRSGSSGHPSKTGTPEPTGTSGTKSPSKPKTGSHRGGQVVSVANGRLILRNRQGQTTTYTLSPNVTVTKTVRGQLSDLAVGETVRIHARPGSTTALAVTIESA